MKNFILVCLILVSVKHLAAWDSTSAKYYPLAVGNSWTYLNQFGSTCGSFNQTYRIKKTIINTVSLNGHLYFTFNNSFYYRIDSLNGNYVYYSTSGCNWMQNEILIDSLASQNGNGFLGQCRFITTCYLSSEFICGETRTVKTFESYYTLGQTDYHDVVKFAENVGIIYSNSDQIHHPSGTSCFRSILLGNVINGEVCGDTSLTGITPISNEIPNQFFLSQNYPNPFNPISKIKFQVSKLSEAKLSVFDVLGNEIAALVNEELKPGTYEVDFDGSNLSSGVYFYTLTAGEFTETKKMVLIK